MDIIQIDNIKADILPFDFNKLNMNPCLDMDRQEEKYSSPYTHIGTGKIAKDKVVKRQYKASNR